ncbi:MAG: TIGR02452 family protein [Planctomycetes bacterium]|nr:TIGR02452 family protein [Planctomycetota bacterium]
MSRKQAAALGRQTLDFLEAGRYATEDGDVVEISEPVQNAVAGVRSYPPGCNPPHRRTRSHATSIEVANETTLAAAQRLVDFGYRPAALNFASAKHPGGGFLSGARAQEESLARSSALYACLNGNPMYEFHRASRDPMYSDYVIYSPEVPVFRDDDGELLASPSLCSFLTSPAVNAKVVLERNPSRRSEIRKAMKRRIAKVLSVAAAHEHEALVLGAWGCGVFGNDTREIAELFRAALMGEFHGAFAQVIFAITDWSAEQRFIGPFRELFGGDL